MGKTIGVVGLWHLGCVLTAAWSRLGNTVIGFDYDAIRVEKLKSGLPPIFEPGLSETIKEGLKKQSIVFSENVGSLSECDFNFLAYDTPVLDDDSSDLTILEKSVEDVRRVMKDHAILIVSSQSPVGYCTMMRKKLQQANSTLDIAYSPENLRLGEAIDCYLNPGRIILGTADKNTEDRCRELFLNIDANLLTMSLESAEMVKHGINSFLSSSIVFANHLSDVCEFTGARIDEVVRGLKSDPRIGEKAYLSPGIGFSGGTLGRDLKVLNQRNNEARGYAKLFGILHGLNAERKYAIVNRVESLLGTVEGKTIGILGLTYKPGTSTLRRSLPLEIVDLLMNKKAVIKVYDPKADYSELTNESAFMIAGDIKTVCDSVDMLLLLTEWEDFKKYDWAPVPQCMKSPIMFDAKNYLDEKSMSDFGFHYYSVGK